MRRPCWLLLASALCIFVPSGAWGQSVGQPQKKSIVAPYALIFGNVFDPLGLAVSGASVEIHREKERKPRWRTQSDVRGEFAIRLPADAARYVLTLRAPGCERETRTVEISNDERIDLVFHVRPKPEGKR